MSDQSTLPEWTCLARILTAVNESEDIETLGDRVLEALAGVLPFSTGLLLVLEMEHSASVVMSAYGAAAEPLFHHALELAPGSWVEETTRARDGSALAQAWSMHLPAVPPAALTLPLTAAAKPVGAFVLYAEPERAAEWSAALARTGDLRALVAREVGLAMHRIWSVRALSGSEEWYRTFIENGLDGIWECDPTGLIRFVNRALAELLGYPESEILGKRFDDLTNQDRPELSALRRALRASGFVSDYNLPVHSRVGADKVVSITIRSLLDRRGELSGYQGIVRDITTRAHDQRELERRNLELQLLHQLAAELNRVDNPQAALEKGLDALTELTHSEAIAIVLRGQEQGARVLTAERGLGAARVNKLAAQFFAPKAVRASAASAAADRLLIPPAVPPHTADSFSASAEDALAADGIRAAPIPGLLVLPVHSGGGVSGAVLIQPTSAGGLSAHEENLINSVAAQVGLAVRQQQDFANLQNEIRRTRAVTRTGAMLQYAPSAEEGMSGVVREIRQVLDASYVVVLLLREQHFEIVAASDTRQPRVEYSISAYEAQMLESDAPRVVSDCEAPQVDPQQRVDLEQLGLRAAYGVRLFAHSSPLGLLFVNQDTPRQWGEDEGQFIQKFAQQMAYGLENKRLLDEIRSQVRQLGALSRVGDMIARTKPPDSALYSIAREIAKVFPADYVSFHLREGGYLKLVAESSFSGAQPVLPILPHQYRTLEELDTVRVNNRDEDAISAAQRDYLNQFDLIADMAAPLLAEQTAMGILYLSQRRPHIWTDREQELAGTFAQQIAAALTNARLLSESQSQVRELQSLARSSMLLAHSRSLETALPQIAAEMRESLKADYVGFHLVEGEFLRIVAEPQVPWANRRYKPAPYHLAVLQHQQRIVVNNRETDCKSVAQYHIMEEAGILANLGVPMIARGMVLGILHVSQINPHRWEQAEIQLVETYARHIAAVLDNVQIITEREARVRELEQLTELNDLALGLLDETSLIPLALDAAKSLLNADQTLLTLTNGSKVRAIHSSSGIVHPVLPIEPYPTLRRVLETTEVFIMDPAHPLTDDPEASARVAYYGIKSSLALRLYTAEETLGALSFGFNTEHEITDGEVQLARSAGNVLTMAFGNARLLSRERERSRRLNQLAEFSVLCGTLHNSAELAQRAVERIRVMLDARAVSIHIAENEALALSAVSGERNGATRQDTLEIKPLLQRLLTLQKPQPIPKLADSPALQPEWREHQQPEGFQALLLLPMIAEHTATGILSVYYAEPREWTDEEIEYAQTIANTVGIALRNIREIDNTRRKSDELAATLDSVFSGVMTTDREGKILSWNRAAREITGYTAIEMTGKYWDQVGSRMGRLRERDSLLDEAMVDKSVRFSRALRHFVRADGAEILLLEAAAPLRRSDGAVRGAVCAFWQQSEVQAQDRTRLEYVDTAIHSLSNKLSVVLNSAEHLQRRDLSAERRAQYAQLLIDTQQDLVELRQHYVDFQREIVQAESEPEQVDLGALVRELLTRCRRGHPGRQFKLDGVFDKVLADPARLKVVLENLLDNAVKYSPPRSHIQLHARAKENTVTLSIHNRGHAIPADQLPRVFERGWRGGSAQPGSGLGLWLARTKLLEMGGDITVDSHARRGTTFTLTLPRKVQTVAAPPSDQAAETP